MTSPAAEAPTATMTVTLYPVFRFVHIVCPECEREQGAMEQYAPDFEWPLLVHHCIFCGYVIMESEWNVVEEDDDADDC